MAAVVGSVRGVTRAVGVGFQAAMLSGCTSPPTATNNNASSLTKLLLGAPRRPSMLPPVAGMHSAARASSQLLLQQRQQQQQQLASMSRHGGGGRPSRPMSVCVRSAAGFGGGSSSSSSSSSSGISSFRTPFRGMSTEQRRMEAAAAAAAAAAAVAAAAKTDLRKVPGVGPKNESLLLSCRIDSLQTLQEVFVKNECDAGRMAGFLRDVVGIRNTRHCAAIVGYLANGGSEHGANGAGLAGGIGRAAGGGITLAVEGNISAGKSTFLKILTDEAVQLRELIEVVPEPVDRWQSVGDSQLNVLDLFYRDPERMAYTFQNYVFISRVVQEHESRGFQKPLRLLERSVFSDRMVFVRAVHDAKWLSDAELEIYDSWFNPVIRYVPGLVPDGFIYLRAEPETCHRRMRHRDRTEEAGVALDYLQNLHIKHEDWLMSGVSPSDVNSPSILGARSAAAAAAAAPNGHSNGHSANGNGSNGNSSSSPRPNNRFGLESAMGGLAINGHNGGQNGGRNPGYGYAVPSITLEEPEAIRGNVLFLKGPEVHPALHNVPALVLDCDTDIDLERDLDAKAHFARQVAEYAAWVKSYTELNAEAAMRARLGMLRLGGGDIGVGNGLLYNAPQILLPQEQQRAPAMAGGGSNGSGGGGVILNSGGGGGSGGSGNGMGGLGGQDLGSLVGQNNAGGSQRALA